MCILDVFFPLDWKKSKISKSQNWENNGFVSSIPTPFGSFIHAWRITPEFCLTQWVVFISLGYLRWEWPQSRLASCSSHRWPMLYPPAYCRRWNLPNPASHPLKNTHKHQHVHGILLNGATTWSEGFVCIKQQPKPICDPGPQNQS